jgi:protein O-mannosyl-transferase
MLRLLAKPFKIKNFTYSIVSLFTFFRKKLSYLKYKTIMAKKNTSVTQNPKAAAPRASVSKTDAATKTYFWKTQLNIVVTFFVLGFLLYGYSLKSDYVLDDQIVITDNQFTKKGFGGIGDIMSKETFVGYFGLQKNLVMGARYRPLSLVTFAIEWGIFAPAESSLPKIASGAKRDASFYNGPEYATLRSVHHFFNILLYCLSALLLYRVLLMLFPPKEEEQWYFNLPFIASLLFLLHPIHVEAVANIKGRDEILSFIGCFATLYYILKYKDFGGFFNIVKAIMTFFLALLAKENALTFLAIIPLTLFCFRNETIKGALRSVLPLLFITLFYLLIRYAIIGYMLSNGKEITDLMNNPFYGMSFGDRFATVFYTLGRYVQLLFFPHPLTHDYYPYQIPIMHWSNWESVASLVLYIAMITYGLWSVLKNKSIIGFGILFYLITLSIVSNIPFSVGTFMNDRFIYLSSVGFCLIIAYGLVCVATKINPKMLGMGILALFCLAYSFKTITRVPDWKNTLSLNTSAINVSPNSARANLFYGVALFQEAMKATNLDERKELMYKALPYTEKAISILPSYGSAMHMSSGLDAEIYQYDKDIDKILNKYASYLRYRELLSIEDIATNGTFIDKYLSYLGNTPEYKEKMIAFYLKIIPMFLSEKKDATNAIRYASNALRIDPGNLEISGLMAKAQQMKSIEKK